MSRATAPGAGRAAELAGSAIEMRDVRFAYGDRPVLAGVTFSVGIGEFVALAGSNGSGKSTLLRILLGLLRPDGGDVRLLGAAPGRLAEPWRVGYVPQRPTVQELVPACVAEIVAAGRVARRGWWRPLRADDRDAVGQALRAVSLSDRAGDRLRELSGGQQQRVFIAKALVSDPDLLILDEPVAGVDAESQRRFRDVLVDRSRERGAAVLLVSHELGAVADDLDRLLVLRQGVVAFDGPPAELAATGVSLGVHDHDLPVWLEGLET